MFDDNGGGRIARWLGITALVAVPMVGGCEQLEGQGGEQREQSGETRAERLQQETEETTQQQEELLGQQQELRGEEQYRVSTNRQQHDTVGRGVIRRPARLSPFRTAPVKIPQKYGVLRIPPCQAAADLDTEEPTWTYDHPDRR